MKSTNLILAMAAFHVAVAITVHADDDAKKENGNPEQETGQAVDPSGTWRLEYDWNGSRIKDSYRLALAEKGKVTGRFHRDDLTLPISDGKVNGDKISFNVRGEYQGTEWVVKCAGKISGDEIEGTAILEGNGKTWDFPWRPKRSVELDDVVGNWRLRVEANGNVYEPTFEISKNSDTPEGVYTSPRAGKLAVKNVAIKNNHLLFTIDDEFNGYSIHIDYKGRPRGDKMSGTLEFDLNGDQGEAEFTATRESSVEE